MNDTHTQLVFNFCTEPLSELHDLKEKTGAKDLADTIAKALGTLKWVTSNLLEGNTIYVKKLTGETAEVDFPYLSTTRLQ